ncbi:MAG: response regulator, partial [Chitinophagales bacterium]
WSVGYKMAVNGKDALSFVDKEQYDLILMDIQMPVMDGYQATIAIRNSHNLNKNTPIVALTASALIDQRDKAFSLGMNGHITKPFTPNQLLEGIKTFVDGGEGTLDSLNLKKTEEDLPLDPLELSIEIPTEEEETEFVFVEALDNEYLQEFYEGDMDYMIDMFESFFESTVPEIPLLKEYAEAEEWIKLSRLAHKIAPTFSIVGLTELEPLFRKVEKLVDANSTGSELIELMENIHQLLPDKVALIQSELNRMKRIHSS